MLSSVFSSFALVPLEKLVGASARAKIEGDVKNVVTPVTIGARKQKELQTKWIADPSKAQLE